MEIYDVLNEYKLNKLVLYSFFDNASLNEQHIIKDDYNIDGEFTSRLLTMLEIAVRDKDPKIHQMTDLIINRHARVAENAFSNPRGVSVWKVNSDLAQLYREYTLDKDYQGDICVALDKENLDNLSVVVGKF